MPMRFHLLVRRALVREAVRWRYPAWCSRRRGILHPCSAPHQLHFYGAPATVWRSGHTHTYFVVPICWSSVALPVVLMRPHGPTWLRSHDQNSTSSPLIANLSLFLKWSWCTKYNSADSHKQ